MQSHDQEVFNKIDFVNDSCTEEAQEGTGDSIYETEEEHRIRGWRALKYKLTEQSSNDWWK